MARPIWRGSVSFGLINIPVRLFSAIKTQSGHFHFLRKDDLCPIQYLRVCRNTKDEVPYENIVRGYEFQKGRYVVMEDEDLVRVNAKKTQAIAIEDFINIAEVDLKMLEKPYYLEPEKGAERTYALFVEALKQTDKVAIARIVIRTKEYLALLRPENNMIILNQMRFYNNLKQPEEINLNLSEAQSLAGPELEMAKQLINQLSVKFEPAKYVDKFEQELEKFVIEKSKGQTVEISESPVPTNYEDIMERLKQSLNQAKK